MTLPKQRRQVHASWKTGIPPLRLVRKYSFYTRIAELYLKHANLPLARTAYAVNVVDHLVENNQNNYIVNIQLPLLDDSVVAFP